MAALPIDVKKFQLHFSTCLTCHYRCGSEREVTDLARLLTSHTERVLPQHPTQHSLSDGREHRVHDTVYRRQQPKPGRVLQYEPSQGSVSDEEVLLNRVEQTMAGMLQSNLFIPEANLFMRYAVVPMELISKSQILPY